jgi:hypothetical protein
MAPAWNSKSFRECLDTSFAAVSLEGGNIPLLLVAVQQGMDTPKVENFSLFFRGPEDRFLPQATYRLQHEKLGTMDMFLVPIGPDGTGMKYEAVFYRLRDSE